MKYYPVFEQVERTIRRLSQSATVRPLPNARTASALRWNARPRAVPAFIIYGLKRRVIVML